MDQEFHIEPIPLTDAHRSMAVVSALLGAQFHGNTVSFGHGSKGGASRRYKLIGSNISINGNTQDVEYDTHLIDPSGRLHRLTAGTDGFIGIEHGLFPIGMNRKNDYGANRRDLVEKMLPGGRYLGRELDAHIDRSMKAHERHRSGGFPKHFQTEYLSDEVKRNRELEGMSHTGDYGRTMGVTHLFSDHSEGDRDVTGHAVIHHGFGTTMSRSHWFGQTVVNSRLSGLVKDNLPWPGPHQIDSRLRRID